MKLASYYFFGCFIESQYLQITRESLKIESNTIHKVRQMNFRTSIVQKL